MNNLEQKGESIKYLVDQMLAGLKKVKTEDLPQELRINSARSVDLGGAAVGSWSGPAKEIGLMSKEEAENYRPSYKVADEGTKPGLEKSSEIRDFCKLAKEGLKSARVAKEIMDRLREDLYEEVEKEDVLQSSLACAHGNNKSVLKDLGVKSIEDAMVKVPDIEVVGNGDAWQLMSKASSKSQGWMKSTKALLIPGQGCLVQVSTQQGDNVAEALAYVPGVSLDTDKNGGKKLVPLFGVGKLLKPFKEVND